MQNSKANFRISKVMQGVQNSAKVSHVQNSSQTSKRSKATASAEG